MCWRCGRLKVAGWHLRVAFGGRFLVVHAVNWFESSIGSDLKKGMSERETEE